MGEQINRAFQFPLTHRHEDIRRASVPVRLRYPSPPQVQVEEGLPEFPGRHCDALKTLLEFSMLQSSDARHYTGPRYSAVISIFNPLVLVGCPEIHVHAAQSEPPVGVRLPSAAGPEGWRGDWPVHVLPLPTDTHRPPSGRAQPATLFYVYLQLFPVTQFNMFLYILANKTFFHFQIVY